MNELQLTKAQLRRLRKSRAALMDVCREAFLAAAAAGPDGAAASLGRSHTAQMRRIGSVTRKMSTVELWKRLLLAVSLSLHPHSGSNTEPPWLALWWIHYVRFGQQNPSRPAILQEMDDLHEAVLARFGFECAACSPLGKGSPGSPAAPPEPGHPQPEPEAPAPGQIVILPGSAWMGALLVPPKEHATRKYPRRFTERELAKFGVTVVDDYRLLLQCNRCSQRWDTMVHRSGRLQRGYWKCPRGCNEP